MDLTKSYMRMHKMPIPRIKTNIFIENPYMNFSYNYNWTTSSTSTFAKKPIEMVSSYLRLREIHNSTLCLAA